jgi:hypothetical protein
LGATATHQPDPKPDEIKQKNVVQGLSGEYVKILKRPGRLHRCMKG